MRGNFGGCVRLISRHLTWLRALRRTPTLAGVACGGAFHGPRVSAGAVLLGGGGRCKAGRPEFLWPVTSTAMVPFPTPLFPAPKGREGA